MTLRERIAEIESERTRVREMLRSRVEAAIKDYVDETGDVIEGITVIGQAVHIRFVGVDDVSI